MNKKSAKTNFLLIGLIGLTLIFIVGSYFEFKSLIRGPFEKNKTKQASVDVENLLIQAQTTDTDSDGLTDFQEQYVYKTSAYLADSDSDGYFDADEILATSNPLDPQSTPLNKQSSKTNLEQTFQNLQQNQELNQPDMSPQEIRDLLINKGGLSQDVVDKLDDKTLIQLYNETKAETGINPKSAEQNQQDQSQQSTTSLAGASLSADQITALQALTPQEIRQLLISGGMNADELNKIDDQALQIIFLQTLSEQK
ncbi:MAG: hypothetical protein PHV78_03085 [Patescibacteria group bacterium]|nr:hypothetical protein [Patescibacteria group bacterium]MDD5121630.1 hypothetical protein [Patescibacteria group bacterium]MDD5221916.1 hypothetical protein [Patescibacteria group bacterium]MDD5396206.1 hypothetical protein [Patescibacteria group bacterium]